MKPEDADWRYDFMPRIGKCRIDGEAITLHGCLYGDTGGVDVLEVERLYAGVVSTPATVEEYADKVSELFPNHSVQLSGQTQTHGPITVRRRK